MSGWGNEALLIGCLVGFGELWNEVCIRGGGRVSLGVVDSACCCWCKAG
jgi:hypothetical protein